MSDTRAHTGLPITRSGLGSCRALGTRTRGGVATVAIAAVILAARSAQAQAAEPPLAPSEDPELAVDDPATRSLALALMAEAARQRHARAFDQALANFLEAYARFPSPRILLDVASTLRDLGRLADAANTYHRYLTDPATGPARVAEVAELLARLDQRLAILTVRVAPRGSEVSIDGGPFIPVGGSLVTRVRTGPHLVRIRNGRLAGERTVIGFPGEHKEVTLDVVPAPAPAPTSQVEPPERIDGWLVTGTQYRTSDATGRERTVRDRSGRRDVSAIVPRDDDLDRAAPELAAPSPAIEAGALGVLRIDGKGRGFAGGLGLALARGRFDAEILVLKADRLGGYLGLRYRPWTGAFRPYVALGAPSFLFDHDDDQPDGTPMTAQRLAVGLRAAAGVELRFHRHLSVQADVGYEHFFFVDEHYEADVLVPTLGMIGRL